MDDTVTSSLVKLQYDLENSLCCLTKKYNAFSKKFFNADGKEKGKASDVGHRRVSISDSKPYKKTKLSSEKTQKSFSVRAKCKRSQPAKSQENGFPEKSLDVPKVQKSDTLNRFWALFDCYCADITSEDIKVLEKWIESHENDHEYQDIPELGEHYSSRWTEDKILEEIKEGTKSMENPRGIDTISEENVSQLEFLRKKAEEKISDFIDSEQPSLIDKLMLSLVQENIITSNDLSESILDDDCQEEILQKPKLPLSGYTLENRLKDQLVELGLLEGDSYTPSDDELLQELKRLQALLIPVTELNVRKKKALLSRAKVEIAKQEAQKRIQEADAKVMESYRTVTAARLKGKKLGKKELSQIRSMLQERDVLIRNKRTET